MFAYTKCESSVIEPSVTNLVASVTDVFEKNSRARAL